MLKDMDFFLPFLPFSSLSLFLTFSSLSPFHTLFIHCIQIVNNLYSTPAVPRSLCQVFRTPKENMSLTFLKLNSLVGVEAAPHIPSGAAGQTGVQGRGHMGYLTTHTLVIRYQCRVWNHPDLDFLCLLLCFRAVSGTSFIAFHLIVWIPFLHQKKLACYIKGHDCWINIAQETISSYCW